MKIDQCSNRTLTPEQMAEVVNKSCSSKSGSAWCFLTAEERRQAILADLVNTRSGGNAPNGHIIDVAVNSTPVEMGNILSNILGCDREVGFMLAKIAFKDREGLESCVRAFETKEVVAERVYVPRKTYTSDFRCHHYLYRDPKTGRLWVHEEGSVGPVQYGDGGWWEPVIGDVSAWKEWWGIGSSGNIRKIASALYYNGVRH